MFFNGLGSILRTRRMESADSEGMKERQRPVIGGKCFLIDADEPDHDPSHTKSLAFLNAFFSAMPSSADERLFAAGRVEMETSFPDRRLGRRGRICSRTRRRTRLRSTAFFETRPPTTTANRETGSLLSIHRRENGCENTFSPFLKTRSKSRSLRSRCSFDNIQIKLVPRRALSYLVLSVGARRLRPLARRRAKTALPDLVCMRFMNP